MTDQINSEKVITSGRSRWANLGIFFSTLAVIIFVCAFGYGYFQLAKVNISIAEMVTDLQKQTTANSQSIENIQKTVTELQEFSQKSKAVLAEQEQFVTEWRAVHKGDFAKWHVAEAQYLVSLANHYLQYAHDPIMAEMLLKKSDQILSNLPDANLIDIRKAITNDLATLQAAPKVDITGLFLKLTTIKKQIEQLPLPSSPVKQDGTPLAPVPADLPWWKAGLQHTWNALRQIIIIRRTGPNVLPLVLPEEKHFLYQNLHAQIENAMWAVLYRNNTVYQSSLGLSIAWITEYFDQQSSQTQSVLQNLQELQQINIEPPTINLSQTLTLFDNYFAQSGQGPVT